MLRVVNGKEWWLRPTRSKPKKKKMLYKIEAGNKVLVLPRCFFFFYFFPCKQLFPDQKSYAVIIATPSVENYVSRIAEVFFVRRGREGIF